MLIFVALLCFSRCTAPAMPWQNHCITHVHDIRGAALALVTWHVTRHAGVAYSSCMASKLCNALGQSSTIDPTPAPNESSCGSPSGNTNQFSMNSSQSPLLQLCYWQVVPGCCSCTFIQYPKKLHLRNKYQLHRRKHNPYTNSWKSSSCCILGRYVISALQTNSDRR